MNELLLNPRHAAEIRAHAERAYPHECCGLLAGKLSAGTAEVHEVRSLTNLHESGEAKKFIEVRSGESAVNRYFVDPGEQLRVEREMAARGLSVLGFYHSHPDNPAVPSECDLARAWLEYIYLIVSVRQGQAAESRVWRLRGDAVAFVELKTNVLF